MRRHVIQRIQRILIIICFLALFGIVVTVARIFGYGLTWSDNVAPQGLVLGVLNKRIALISGHAGSDSGATCTDANGTVTLTEADVNANVTRLAAQRLRRAGARVTILDEFDSRLDNLQVDVLLSLHADSCIPASGYKAAYYTLSKIPTVEDRILACIDHYYAADTGLRLHANTVTHNMTEYHAFRVIAPTTPAAILETGFLGGDQDLLTHQTGRVARGVADSLLCFLEDKPEPAGALIGPKLTGTITDSQAPP